MNQYLHHKFNKDDSGFVSVIDELPLWSAPFGMDLLQCVKLKAGIKVLDIGCGLGFPLIELSQRIGDTGKLFGIDPWESALERIKLKIKILDIKNVEVLNAVAEDIPFDDNYFDLIVSNNGINNVENLPQTISECYRVCKSESQFVLSFNLPNTMTTRLKM